MYPIIAASRLRSTYSSELRAIINRAIAEGFTLPSVTTLEVIDVLIRQMILDGYWQKRDLILNFAYNDINCRDFSRINWKNPTGNLATETNPFYNLFPRSEELDNGLWSKVVTTITTNNTIAPDGTLTGDLLTAGGITSRVQGSATINNNIIIGLGLKYNYSCYAKAGTHSILRIAQGTGNIATFDLINVTAVNNGNGQNATITAEPNGWYRCSVDIELTTSNIPAFFYGGAVGTSMYLWGLQATEGFGVKPYQKTEQNYSSLQYSTQGFHGGVNWNASVSSYQMNTGYNPFTDGINYSLNNASQDVIVQNNINTNNWVGAAEGTSSNNLRIGSAGINSNINASSGNLNSAIDTTSLGYIGLNRINSTDIKVVVKNVISDRTQTSTSINNNNQLLWRRLTSSQGGRYSYFSMGAEVVTEGQLFRTAYTNYLNSIGLDGSIV
jgi:hypothetical protein